MNGRKKVKIRYCNSISKGLVFVFTFIGLVGYGKTLPLVIRGEWFPGMLPAKNLSLGNSFKFIKCMRF